MLVKTLKLTGVKPALYCFILNKEKSKEASKMKKSDLPVERIIPKEDWPNILKVVCLQSVSLFILVAVNLLNE